jgi:CubicO group peptidase (beta-lactamase class C family)
MKRDLNTISRRALLQGAGAGIAGSFVLPRFLSAADAKALRKRADALLKGGVDAGDVPGVVAMATNRKETTYAGGFGKRVVGQPAAMSEDTVVWIASMTKALTGTAAMQLVEQGKLDLDSPASKWVPQLGKVQVLEGFDNAGKPKLRAPKRAITLRHLLTHTAGFAYDIWSEDIAKYMKATDTPGIISCTNAALTTPLLFDPGDRWEYGIGIDFAGKAVEAVSGKKLGAYLTDNLFKPLGMNDTTFKITPAMRARLAKIHARDDKGLWQPIELEIPQEPEFEMGGGGLYGTTGDYLKFVRMILNGGTGNGNRVLKAETVKLMSTNQMGATNVHLLKTAQPGSSNDAEFFPGMEKKWGLTFMINTTKAPTGRSPGSLAWAGLANTYFWIDPTKGVGGAYSTQTLPFADAKALPLFYAFEKAVYDTMA